MKKKIKLRDLTWEQYDQWLKTTCKNNKDPYKCDTCIICCFHCFSLSNKCWIHNKDMCSDKFLDQEVEIETSTLFDRQEKVNKVYQESGLTEACASLEPSECKYPIFNEGTLMDLCVEILESDTPNFEILKRIILALNSSSASGYYYCKGKFKDNYLQFNELDKIEAVVPINYLDVLFNLVKED